MPKTSRSLNDISYHILNTVRGNRSKDYPDLSIDQIKDAVKYYRALLIRRDQQKNFNRYRMFEQDLGLVTVDYYDTAEDPNTNSNIELIRTDSKIPSPIRMKEWEGITYVGRLDKSGEPFPLVDAHRSWWNQYNKFTSDEPEAFYRNGYVYVRNTNVIDEINIRGVFEDPEEVYNFKGEDEEKPFPIPEDMVQRITQSLLNGELSFAVQSQAGQQTTQSE
jgi:hypothetical protein